MSTLQNQIKENLKNIENPIDKSQKKQNESSSSKQNNSSENFFTKIISPISSEQINKVNSVNENKLDMNINMNINVSNFYPLYITDTKMIEKFNEEKIKKNFHVIVKNQNV